MANTDNLEFKLSVNLDESTVRKLRKGGFSMSLFIGTEESSSNMLSTPLAIVDSNLLEETIEIVWTNKYKAYKSQSKVDSGSIITTSTKRDVDLGDIFEIKEDRSVEVFSGGLEHQISYHNKSTSITVGYTMSTSGTVSKTTPVCAFEIPGNSMAHITPKQKILVSFNAKGTVKNAVCIKKINSAVATVEYFDDIESHTVKYDYDTGMWSADESVNPNYDLAFGWFKAFKTGIHIVNDLIN